MSLLLAMMLAALPVAATPAVADPLAEPELAQQRLAPSVVFIHTKTGFGSGFVVSRNGLVLSNAHVVEQQATVGVVMHDGRTLTGTVIFISVFRPHPANRSEAGQMADEYNERLRKKLGLKDREARLRLTPAMGRQYTGLALSGRF